MMAARTTDTPDRDLLDEWELQPDGAPMRGTSSQVLPVRTADGQPAVLKVGAPDEHLVLRRWSGRAAVRLLRADPRRRALLLERLRPESLAAVPDTAACEVVAGLYRLLHVPAMPQLPTLSTCLEQWRLALETLPRGAPIPHRLVEQALALTRDLAAEPAATVVHGNLHYEHVLAADREPWLAIAPRPVNGDPHFEVAPMLWTRWDEITDDVRGGVQRRFYALLDAADLDEDRARAWVLVRAVVEATRSLTADPQALTTLVALVKAVQH